VQGFSAFSAFSLALYHLLIPLKTLCLKGFEFIQQALGKSSEYHDISHKVVLIPSSDIQGSHYESAQAETTTDIGGSS